MKKTPLYDTHCSLGGKIIDFAGWALPVRYTDIIEEHRQVRAAAGLFDVSHMGKIIIDGNRAFRFVQKMLTNDISPVEYGRAVYSPMCGPDGGIIDDLLVYRISDSGYMLVVNAINTAKDLKWLRDNLDAGNAANCRNEPDAGGAAGLCNGPDTDSVAGLCNDPDTGGDGEEHIAITDATDEYAQLALQGPKAARILQETTSFPLSEIGFYRFKCNVRLAGITALVSRTGYTGEDGFEIYLDPEKAPGLWMKLLNAGAGEGLVPVGLGARDTLRFEAALPLYGHEISDGISPFEAGLGMFVKFDKGDFTGRDALLAQKTNGVSRKIAGFEMVDRGVPRNGYEVVKNCGRIGYVTTGGYSPSLDKNIGLALVDRGYTYEGAEFDVVIRGRVLKAAVVKTPFHVKRYVESDNRK